MDAIFPEPLRERFAEWSATLHYAYAPDIPVWRLERGGRVRYLKLGPPDRYPSLAAERDRTVWARSWVPVPEVAGYGVDGHTEWLLTEQLPGRDATQPEHLADPATTVRLLAGALRSFHDALPVERCPFDFTNDAALAHVRRQMASDIAKPDWLHPELEHLTLERALGQLEASRPESEDLVVCHGDYCFPNVLIDAGMVVGYLDLGELGVADRWWDVAVGAWSTTWNVGPGYEELFYESYGVEPDAQRITFYRLLYDLAS